MKRQLGLLALRPEAGVAPRVRPVGGVGEEDGAGRVDDVVGAVEPRAFHVPASVSAVPGVVYAPRLHPAAAVLAGQQVAGPGEDVRPFDQPLG